LSFVVGVLKETLAGERRVAMVPRVMDLLTKSSYEVRIESGAGTLAGFTDQEFASRGAAILSRAEVIAQSDVILAVQIVDDEYRRGQAVIGFADPLGSPMGVANIARRGVTILSMEMIPRITRAQSMDALSSMATVAGYKAVLIAASELPRMFPLLMTAAGTIPPARVFVIGAGVAGLQAIATAKRLGAVVTGYDVRAAVKEQIESLGAKFASMQLEAAEGQGGYARAMDDDYYRRQREQMANLLKDQDVVITTASIPGKKAPVLITREMVGGMAPGSVIVDLAAERGGNCELTRAGETVVHEGVKILGPVNLPSSVPYHASQMYARNVATLLKHLVKDGALHIDTEDEITRETMIVRDGEIVHPRVKQLLETAIQT
jgi:NAD(P) transhydrogenase subunit alpha